MGAPTVREILQFLKDECESDSRIEFGKIKLRESEPDCVADMTMLSSIGFSPEYSWKEGLKRMVKEIKKT